MERQTDVVIVGAGIVGSAIARELSKYKLDVTGKETIHHGFVDKALPGEETSLYQLFVENSKMIFIDEFYVVNG